MNTVDDDAEPDDQALSYVAITTDTTDTELEVVIYIFSRGGRICAQKIREEIARITGKNFDPEQVFENLLLSIPLEELKYEDAFTILKHNHPQDMPWGRLEDIH